MHSLNNIPDKPAGQSDFNNALNMENFEVDDDDDDGFFTNQESETCFFKAKNKWL